MNRTIELLFRGSFLRVASLVINILVAFYMMPFVIGVLGDRWYGLWTVLGSLMGYYSLLDLGLSTATSRYIAVAKGKSDIDERNSIIVTSLIIFLVIGLFTLMISFCVAMASPLFFKDLEEIKAFKLVTIILGTSVALSFIFSIFQGMLSAYLRFDFINITGLLSLFIRTALIVYFLKSGYGIIALGIITDCLLSNL
jgi:O-antigen/teichoic acid export membrane protein